jgi:hypothetical protein
MRGETNAETSRCAGYDDCAVGLVGHGFFVLGVLWFGRERCSCLREFKSIGRFGTVL